MDAQQHRWKDRLTIYGKALARLEDFASRPDINDMEATGLIKAFEFTLELAWKTLKDLFIDQKYENIGGPTSVLRQAFKDGWIEDATAWEKMLDDRNLAAHVYRETLAEQLADDIKKSHLPLIRSLYNDLDAYAQNE